MSNWFKGLLLAERLGVEESQYLLAVHEFEYCSELATGIQDYIQHELTNKQKEND